jgi:hypothetical protein
MRPSELKAAKTPAVEDDGKKKYPSSVRAGGRLLVPDWQAVLALAKGGSEILAAAEDIVARVRVSPARSEAGHEKSKCRSSCHRPSVVESVERADCPLIAPT